MEQTIHQHDGGKHQQHRGRGQARVIGLDLVALTAAAAVVAIADTAVGLLEEFRHPGVVVDEGRLDRSLGLLELGLALLPGRLVGLGPGAGRREENSEKDRKRQEEGKLSRDPDAQMVNKGKRRVVGPDGKERIKQIRYRGYKLIVLRTRPTSR